MANSNTRSTTTTTTKTVAMTTTTTTATREDHIKTKQNKNFANTKTRKPDRNLARPKREYIAPTLGE